MSCKGHDSQSENIRLRLQFLFGYYCPWQGPIWRTLAAHKSRRRTSDTGQLQCRPHTSSTLCHTPTCCNWIQIGSAQNNEQFKYLKVATIRYGWDAVTFRLNWWDTFNRWTDLLFQSSWTGSCSYSVSTSANFIFNWNETNATRLRPFIFYPVFVEKESKEQDIFQKYLLGVISSLCGFRCCSVESQFIPCDISTVS